MLLHHAAETYFPFGEKLAVFAVEDVADIARRHGLP